MADYEDTNVKDLIINNMSQEKFDELKAAGELDPTQLYFTPEEGGGGDYLPLSGGEITGRINYNAGELTTYSWKDKPLFTTTFTTVDGSYTYEEAGLYASTLGLCLGHKNSGSPMLTFLFRDNKIEPQHNVIQFGTYANVFASVATKKIVSGIDTSDYSINEIIVPEKKGTMLVNQATGNNALTIGGTAATSARAINIGFSSSVNDIGATAIGYLSKAKGIASLALGAYAQTNALGAIQITASSSFQTNNDSNTFKVANVNGNFELMSADGTMPTDRYTTTPTVAGTYVPKLTIAEDGTATREWGTESGGASGDYLPLSGGTLTGKLKINPEVSETFGDVLVLSYGDNDVVIKKSRYDKSLNLIGTTLTVGKLMAGGIGATKSDIGSPTGSFGRVYTAQLSSSTSYSDEHYLSIPNKDGTIATVEDIEAAVGDISTALTAILGE